MRGGTPRNIRRAIVPGASQATFEGVPVHVYLDFREVTANGVMGDPAVSSAAVGA